MYANSEWIIQACSETFQRLHSPGNWAMFPDITTFSFKYVPFLAFSLVFGLKSDINYKGNIAELPANKNQNFSNYALSIDFTVLLK